MADFHDENEAENMLTGDIQHLDVINLCCCWYLVESISSHLQEGWTITVNSIFRQPRLFEHIFLHPFLTVNMILQNERL